MNYFKIFLPILILIASCRAITSSADQPKFEATRWKLIAMNQKAIEPGDQAYLEFNDLKLTGKAACNTIAGEYEMKRNKVTFSKIISTKMFCDGLMDQENTIITNLQKITRYEIRYGLLYLYSGNNLLLTYKK